jgi:HD superfamily phosphohydrolase
MANALSLPQEEKNSVMAAALLHDIGHPPYSHTLEVVLCDRIGLTHVDFAKSIINGEISVLTSRSSKLLGVSNTIADLLDRSGISPEVVVDLITSSVPSSRDQTQLEIEEGQTFFGGKNYLKQMIHGPVDADQMDYLLRDAHYTGVAHGTIDLDRLLQTIGIFHGDLVVDKGGIVAVEGLLVARALMYTSVYFHKTVRIAEMMLCKAAESARENIFENIQIDTDCTFAAKLFKAGAESARIMTMLQYRRLYKKAFSINISDLDDATLASLIELTDYYKRKEVERKIAERARVKESEVIVDVPEKELLVSEPRIGKTEVPILDGNRVRPLTRHSPIAKALQTRSVHSWAVMVSTPEKHKEVVEKASRKVLFS